MKIRVLILCMQSMVLFFLPAFLNAQDLAITDYNKSEYASQMQKDEERSLEDVLHQIEEHFSISIAYESGIIDGKKIALFDVSSFRSPENALKKALMNYKLTFKKVRSNFYFIEEEKPKVRTQSQPKQEDRQRTVVGKVTDESGNPLPGVTVKLKGTNVGTVTDANGAFALTIAETENAILEISFIGYATKDLPVGDQTEFEIILKEATSTLNAVVVTGYTSQLKKDLTGAVDVVNVKDMIKQPTGEVTKMLQGQASGVTVMGSGQPGDEPMVLIRGINTFGDNSPLYIIDGVPTESVWELNPNDIASMQVLKDAGAASIYGSRASNGVIVITTKKGRGKIKVQYDAYYGRQYPKSGNVWHLLNPIEMATLKWNSYKNSGLPTSGILYGNGTEPVLPDYIQPEGAMEGDPGTDPSEYFVDPHYTGDEYYDFHRITKANKKGTDWYHAIFKPASITSHNLNVSGGGEKGNYLFSLNYFNQQGTLIYTYLKRYAIRSNTQYNITPHIQIGENLFFSVSDNPTADILEGNSSGAPISNAYKMLPIIPVYDIKGNFAGSYGSELGDSDNPVAIMFRQRNDKSLDNHLFGNIYANIEFFKYFTFHTSFGGAINSGWSHSFTYPTYENSENDQNNSFDADSYHDYNWTWTNTLTFHRDFNATHNLKILLGTEANQSQGVYVGGQTTKYFSFDPDYTNLSTGSGVKSNYSGRYQNSLYSLFGRVDYSYKDKYLFSATLRRDGTSKLLNNRYGWFPAASAAWRISQEGFMGNIPWLTDLKIRGSWGVMGNQRNVDADNAYTLYGGNLSTSYYDISGTNKNIVLGFQQDRIGNPDAKWEKDINANIGIDAVLFDGGIELTADYYRKDIKDLLYAPELPGVAGVASTPYVNIASMKNKGIDVSLTGRTSISSEIEFYGRLTFTTYKNEIIKVSNTANYFDADHIRNQVGHPLSSFFGYKIAGFWDDDAEIKQADAIAQKNTGDEDAIYQEAEGVGRFRYADVNNDGQITPDDRTFLGNPNPKFTAGLNLGLTYKNFDFSAFLYENYGNKLWNQVRWQTDFFNHKSVSSKTALYNSWTPENHHAKAPIQLYVSNFSTNGADNAYFVESGSYLRLKNMQVGYTFPKSLLNRIDVQRLRIYVQAANLFTITKYSGIDPEISGDVTEFGIDTGTYPSQLEILAGINITF